MEEDIERWPVGKRGVEVVDVDEREDVDHSKYLGVLVGRHVERYSAAMDAQLRNGRPEDAAEDQLAWLEVGTAARHLGDVEYHQVESQNHA